MAHVQYETTVDWDSTLKDVGFLDDSLSSLVISAVKTTSGAPTATAGKFAPGAIVNNIATGVLYVNTGSTASPVFSVIDANTGGLPSLTSANMWVGNGSNVATAVAMSGDATMANTGAVTIAAGAVTKTKLATGVRPSHMIVFAGQPTTVGGAAAEAITVTGALGTDLAFVQMVNDGTNNVTIVSAAVSADTLTVTFSADPGNDAVINYQIVRATS